MINVEETRKQFHLPEGVVYLNGNSLGPMSQACEAAINHTAHVEWKEGLVKSWSDAEWITLSDRTGALIAPLIGATPQNVMVADTVSINIFKLASAALKLRPGRHIILTEEGSFPTDGYVLDGLAQQTGAIVKRVKRQDLVDSIDDQTAMVLATHVHYVTGDLIDLSTLNAAAHAQGALSVIDLSHTVGAIPVDLDGTDTDFAVGCGYKYLNGGPGAPGFAYVNARYRDDLWQPLTGWMGHAAPFTFDEFYAPASGVARLKVGTPPILSMSSLNAALSVFVDINMQDIWAQSKNLSERFRIRLENAALPGLSLVSPNNPNTRGSHLSYRHEEGYPIMQALIKNGVIGDFRAPDFIRFGFAPLYVTPQDVDKAVKTLISVIQSETYRQPAFQKRKAVT